MSVRSDSEIGVKNPHLVRLNKALPRLGTVPNQARKREVIRLPDLSCVETTFLVSTLRIRLMLH